MVHEQRTVIKFYVKLGKNMPEIKEDLQKVYGDSRFTSSYPQMKSEGYSFGVVRPSILSVCPHFLSVWNHISGPIGQI